MKWCYRCSAVFVLLVACHTAAHAQHSGDRPLFSLMDAKQTGVAFLNTIKETDSLNVLRYEYLYNGAGVGVGDFNNDGLPDIFFSGNTSPNKLFLNKGNFAFEDITAQAQVSGNGTWGTGVSIADVNGDGLTDIYVCHSGKFSDPKKLSNELFINQGVINGRPVFKEMAAAYGLDAPGTQSTQAVFFDYDRDGDLDMFLLNHSNNKYDPFLHTSKLRSIPDLHFGNRLFRHDRDPKGNPVFTDVTLQTGIINNALNFGLSVTVSDINKDGWPDLYTTSDYTEKDCYYVNNHDGTFTESLQQSFAHISKYSMGADVADYNNDSRPDVFTLDMLPEDNHRQKLLKGPDDYDQYHLLVDSGFYFQQMRNMLQLNEGTDQHGQVRFSEIGQLAGISNTDWSWSALLADFDNDGWKDLFVSNGYLRDFTNMDFLKFAVTDAKIAAAKRGNQNFQTYDLVKQMPSNKLTNYIFQNNHDLTFSNRSSAWGLQTLGVSNAAAYADLDNDGDLDLIICNNNQPAMLYRNNEQELFHRHYISVRLNGNDMNTLAYGTKVEVTTPDQSVEYQELYPVRGYQSTVTQTMTFGLGNNTLIDKIRVTWPSGKQTALENIKADQTLSLREADARPGASPPMETRKIFEDVTAGTGLDFTHRKNDFIDFKSEPLLPYQLSKQGPALARADANGDGLEDIFLGGDVNQSSVLYLQNDNGTFRRAASQPWQQDSASEEVCAVFFDVNNDLFPDLYVVCGGNVYDDHSPEYQDKIYINDGKGNFSLAIHALPEMLSSKGAVAVGDFDQDGYQDLFVGGSGVPGSFPLIAKSYVLHNDSKGGSIHFSDVTDSICPALRLPGMVTAASFVRTGANQFPDLLIAGDWMGVKLFKNDHGLLQNVSDKAGLSKLSGMWASITPADVDGDGDMDFILGNCGFNNQFKASVQEPVQMYVSDFDNDGVVDPVMCYYIGGTSYPMASKDELLDQIPSLKKKFVKYSDYADVTIDKIFSQEQLRKATVYTCDQFASGILYNNGNDQFEFQAFPLMAQMSKIYGAVVDDFDHDGIPDVLVAGNYYSYKTQLGRDDASLGLLLKGLGNRQFKPVEPSLSGCYIDGDVRAVTEIKDKKNNLIIVGKNGGKVQVIKSNRK